MIVNTRAPTTGVGSPTSLPSQLLGTAIDLMAMYNRSGRLNDPLLLRELCITLARGIDFAVANKEVPLRSYDLSKFLLQINRWKYDLSVQVPFMILMMSVKSACQNGWFPKKETDDLLSLVNEVKRLYTTEDGLREPCDALSCISRIMYRFYPKLKLKSTLASAEIKPGYRICVIDFNILRGMMAYEHEKIGIIVARVDGMDTSSCIITPQEVNFLLNGEGVPGRNNTAMEGEPQLPTNVTAMLKYGVNFLQAVGNFDGHYIIIVAIMSVISSFDIPRLQEYVQPVVPSGDSDINIIEMSSRISLNCPISRRRMRIPVRGHLCKHPQCFDCVNFMEINSRRPFWQCPICKKPVCCSDMRIDQKIVKVLREVGESTVNVLVSKDGSWEDITDQSFQKEGQERSHSLSSIMFGDSNCVQKENQSFSGAENFVPFKVNNVNKSTSSGLAKNYDISRVLGTEVLTTPSLVSMQNRTGPLRNNLPTQNLRAYSSLSRPPSPHQSGLRQNHKDLNASQLLGNTSGNVRGSIYIQPAPSQSNGDCQASRPAQLVPLMLNTQQSGAGQHPRMNSTYYHPVVAEQLRTAGEQRQNVHEEMHPMSGETGTVALPSGDWRPTGRMRGSLKGEAYSEALKQFMSKPTQPARVSKGGSQLP